MTSRPGTLPWTPAVKPGRKIRPWNRAWDPAAEPRPPYPSLMSYDDRGA